MPWYSVATVTVNNGQTLVTAAAGAGVDFLKNVTPGDAFALVGGYANEIASVDSATTLTLRRPFIGDSGGGKAYVIIPTVGIYVDLALRALNMLTPFQAVLDGIGQGLVSAGTVTAPGVRFTADQDTGWRRVSENLASLVAGGVDRLSWGMAGVGVGTTNPGTTFHVQAADQAGARIRILNTAAGGQAFDWVAGVTNVAQTGFSLYDATNGATRVTVNAAGDFGIGTTSPQVRFHAKGVNELARFETAAGRGGGNSYAAFFDATGRRSFFGHVGGNDAFYLMNEVANDGIIFGTNATERARIDINGQLLVGVTSGISHTIAMAGSVAGTQILDINFSANFKRGDSFGFNSAATCLNVGRRDSTGRSVNLAGTLNANGADVAEYLRKALGCGSILKGQLCGIDAAGELVTRWSAAKSFGGKSTDPNIVGGDTWAAHLPERPIAPVFEAPGYDGPAEPVEPRKGPLRYVPEVGPEPAMHARAEGEDDESFAARAVAFAIERAAWLAEIMEADSARQDNAAIEASYPQEVAAYAAERQAYDEARASHADEVAAAEAAHAQLVAAHEIELAAWEEELEHARQGVDRIAFCGQVPIDVEITDADVGGYIVAVEGQGDTIVPRVVAEDDMTLPLYMRRIGRILARLTGARARAIEAIWNRDRDPADHRPAEGRAWVDVQRS